MKGLIDGSDQATSATQFDVAPDASEFPRYRQALDLALGHCWRSEWWPELMLGELRYFRNNWASGSTYNKTDEVYDAATQAYFQALRNSVTGSGQSPTTSTGAERSDYWARCRASYGGANWVTATSYTVGQTVFYPPTNRYYQCHTAHTSSGTLVPPATGGNERWGILTPFKRNITKDQSWETNEIGDVHAITDQDPEVFPRWKRLDWGNGNGDLGIVVVEEAIRAWVTFRRPRPRLKGAVYDEDEAYATGDQIYFPAEASDETPGNFYNCLATTVAGESPLTDADLWAVVEIPQTFYAALVHMGVSKLYQPDGQQEKMAIPAGMAEEDLGLEADVIYRQQGQSPPVPMRTY
jgi:hypothetical protein